MCSLESWLHYVFLCSVGTRSRTLDILQKPSTSKGCRATTIDIDVRYDWDLEDIDKLMELIALCPDMYCFCISMQIEGGGSHGAIE